MIFFKGGGIESQQEKIMVSPTNSFIEELAQLDKIQLVRSSSDIQHGVGVEDEEGGKDDALSSKCCFIRTSSLRRTIRGKKSGRCKKMERNRDLVLSLLGEIIESVEEASEESNSTRFLHQLPSLQVESPETQLFTELSCSTPCQGDICGTPCSFQSFVIEPDLCQLSGHNA